MADGGESRGRSVAARAIVAFLLLLGFYLLVIVVAVVLIVVPIVVMVAVNTIHFGVLMAPVLGFALLWSLVPRRAKWSDPGVLVEPAGQPELWALVDKVADRVGQRRPEQLFLIDEVNAFVTSRGGFLGLGGRRVLAVGVPLMMFLDADELESVLAHEFGHFYGGDTKLAPIVYRTRSAMGRTMSAAGGLRALFKGYASFYLRHTQSVSRAQELSADRLAAEVTSPDTVAAALSRLVTGSAAFDYYWAQEYAPVVRTRHWAPYLDGFAATLGSTVVATEAPRLKTKALGREAGSAFDSHPSLGERIRALGLDPASIPERLRPATPASAMLRDLPRIEAALVGRQVKAGLTSLERISWEESGPAVLVPAWRSEVAELLAPASPDLRAIDVPTTADGLAELGERALRVAGRSGTRPERERIGRRLCSLLLGVAAHDAGFEVQSLPGEPLRYVRADGTSTSVPIDYPKVCAGEIDAARWRAAAQAAGLVTTPAMAAGGDASAPPHVLDQNDPTMGAVVDAAVDPGRRDAGPSMTSSPAPPASAFTYRAMARAGLGAKKALVIDGSTLRLGDDVVRADEVTSARFYRTNQNFHATLASPRSKVSYRANVVSGSAVKEAEAWSAILKWAELEVIPRMVDRLLATIDASGEVTIGSLAVRRDGVAKGNARVPWDRLAGTRFDGSGVTVYQAADTIDGRKKLVTVGSSKHDAVVIPELLASAAATFGS